VEEVTDVIVEFFNFLVTPSFERHAMRKDSVPRITQI
jgi:hypothetical protein